MTPALVFDPVIHAPGRLQICAILSSLDEAEFALIRDSLKVSDSVLSKHLKQLEDVGYVKLTKTPVDGRQRTWASLTPAGKTAFVAHVAELTRLAGIAAAPPDAGKGRADRLPLSPGLLKPPAQGDASCRPFSTSSKPAAPAPNSAVAKSASPPSTPRAS